MQLFEFFSDEPKDFGSFFWSTLSSFSGLYHYIPVAWNSSSCSLFSSLIAAMTSLNAPFKRFPSTMWSGSALSRTPYLSLLVDSVTWRTLSSYINTPRERKKKKEDKEQPPLTAWQLWKGYKTRGHSSRDVVSLKLQIFYMAVAMN